MKKGKPYIIPATFKVGADEWVPFEKYPGAVVFGDNELAMILQASKSSIQNWRKQGLIPYTARRGYNEYKLLDVVRALEAAGFGRDIEDNPTGPTGMSYQ